MLESVSSGKLAGGTVPGLKIAARTFTVACIAFCYHCNNVTTEVVDVTVKMLANGHEVEASGTAIMNGVSTASLENRGRGAADSIKRRWIPWYAEITTYVFLGLFSYEYRV